MSVRNELHSSGPDIVSHTVQGSSGVTGEAHGRTVDNATGLEAWTLVLNGQFRKCPNCGVAIPICRRHGADCYSCYRNQLREHYVRCIWRPSVKSNPEEYVYWHGENPDW